jgi:large subunit ribosomal protein L9
MQIILLEKIDNLGDLGALVNVKAGFARNYLIPQGKATVATEENRVDFETRRNDLEQAALEKLTAAEQRHAALDGQQIEIAGKASEEGKLFGSVGVIDIANAMTEKGIMLGKSEVRLPDGPIKMVGEYQVLIHIHTEVECEIEVSVVPE